jgi:hypothetical protein
MRADISRQSLRNASWADFADDHHHGAVAGLAVV